MSDGNRPPVDQALRTGIERARRAFVTSRRMAGRLRTRLRRPTAERRGEPASDPVPAASAAPTPGELESRLTEIRWVAAAGEPARLAIKGFAYRRGGSGTGSSIAVDLITSSGQVPLTVRRYESWLVNELSTDARHDHAGAAFEAHLDLSRLPMPDGSEPFEDLSRFAVSVADDQGRLTGGFGSRDGWGSPGELHSADLGDGRTARPEWDRNQGLMLRVARRAVVAETLQLTGHRLTATVRCRGDFVPRAALLRRGDDIRPVELTRAAVDGGPVEIGADLGELVDSVPDTSAARSWYLQMVDDQDRRRYVHWQGTSARGTRIVSETDPRLAVRFSPKGLVRLDVHPRRLAAETVVVDADRCTIVITGEFHALATTTAGWSLSNGRIAVPADDLRTGDGRFEVRFGLRAPAPWTGTPLPLPLGGYRLQVTDGDRTTEAIVDPRLAERIGPATLTPDAEIRAERNPNGQLNIRIRPPLERDELGAFQQRRLADLHRTAGLAPTDTVYLESFNGKSANDNTLAIYRELRRRRPDLRMLWTVADLSVELPEGAEPLLLRSSAWWTALASSRYVVTNCWMTTRFEHRPHQRVLQAWHGTPLKLLGFDRIGTNRGDAYRAKTLREVGMWDQLIAQNPYSADIFRRAYGYGGEVLEIGYPRNDVLRDPHADRVRARVRDRLGLADGEQAVLYVPTWRENARGLFRELDFDLLTEGLGPDVRLLVRGHSNTIRSDRAVTGRRLLDVTLYPDLADLYLVADVMITDYSSTMFDFSVTGKPMIFFAPDIDQYSGSLRGTYFDLKESAPGPVVASTEQVIQAWRNLDHISREYASAYAAWRARFNPYDDGHAAERAVDALLG